MEFSLETKPETRPESIELTQPAEPTPAVAPAPPAEADALFRLRDDLGIESIDDFAESENKKLRQDQVYVRNLLIEHQYEVTDPSAWLALHLDQSLPLDEEVRRAYIANARSRCRQFFLPIARPLLHLLVGIIQLLKALILRDFSAHQFLHRCVAWGLHLFVKPEANFLILRHFHLGTQILDFLSQNLDCQDAPLEPIRPLTVFDLQPNGVLLHDVNLYNFIIHLNRKRGFEVAKNDNLNFSSLEQPPLSVSDFRRSWSNVLDLESALEVIAPLFQLLTTDDEYWRASISLQLDETIALYTSRLLGQPERMAIVNNKHPLIANNIVEAPRRLLIHGLSTEMAHQALMQLKAKRNA